MSKPSLAATRPAHPQRGVSLLFALITLVVLMLTTLALVRNVDTGSLLLGNLGFKQDATASADQVTSQAVAWLNVNSANLNSNLVSDGYYASNREFQTDGVTSKDPIDTTGGQLSGTAARQLIDWNNDSCASSASSTYSSCDIKTKAITTPINGNTGSYVILRMCNKVGDYTTDTTINCTKPQGTSTGGIVTRGDMSYSDSMRFGSTAQTYFRILVRVQGARGTTSFTETIVHF